MGRADADFEGREASGRSGFLWLTVVISDRLLVRRNTVTQEDCEQRQTQSETEISKARALSFNQRFSNLAHVRIASGRSLKKRSFLGRPPPQLQSLERQISLRSRLLPSSGGAS